MTRQTRADLAMTVSVFCLGASLVLSGVSLLRLRWTSIFAAQPLDLPELLGMGCAGAGIALLGWWLLALVCACISTAAQTVGALRLAAFTRSCSPAFMRRVVISVLGVNLLAAPLTGAAASPGLDLHWHANTVSTAPASPGIGVGAEDGATTSPGPGQEVLPVPATNQVEPRWVPHTAAVDPGMLVSPGTRTEPTHPGSGPGAQAGVPVTGEQEFSADSDVVVTSGDSLWSIVAGALGPFSTDEDVALAWPGWYRANRGTIGEDPNYILPGQVLHAPR